MKFPESSAFRCVNAHLKKELLENIEKAKKQLDIQDDDRKYIEKGSNIIEEEDETAEDNGGHERHKSLPNLSNYERGKVLRELFSDFDILLALRDFENAVDMLLKIKHSTKPDTESLQSLIYKQKETELINILRKDLVSSKERGNNKGVVKTGKRVVNSLIRLNDESITFNCTMSFTVIKFASIIFWSFAYKFVNVLTIGNFICKLPQIIS